jgi:hypothetical protein
MFLILSRTGRTEIQRPSCSRKKINIFVDGGQDPDLAMECVCRAMDSADCPELLHIFVLVPLSSSLKPTVWDTSLTSTCAAYPRYTTFFEANVHIYKMSLRSYGSGGIGTVTDCVQSLQSLKDDDLVMWLPYLSKLEISWDTKLFEEWSSLLPQSLLSFPLQQAPSLEKGIEDMILFKKIESFPCFYFLTPTYDLSIRPQAKPQTHPSLYISTGYPLLTEKRFFFIHSTDDLSASYALWKLKVSLYVSKHSLGFTFRNQSSSPVLPDEEWSNLIGIKKGTVSIQALMGMSDTPSLDEKILKYGSEIKYESFKETLMMEDYQE